MVYFCCVNGCKTEWYSGCGLSFHRIPKNESMAERWKENLPDKFTKTSVVCSLHFKDEDFVNQSRKRLKSTAIPSIFPKIVPAEKHIHVLSIDTALGLIIDTVSFTNLATDLFEENALKYLVTHKASQAFK